MKKIISIAVAMMMAMWPVCVCAETGGHEYRVYQVYANEAWGTGVDSGLGDYLIADDYSEFEDWFMDCSSDSDFGPIMDGLDRAGAKYKYLTKAAYLYVKDDAGISLGEATDLEPGYYLVCDCTASDKLAAGDARAIPVLVKINTSADLPVMGDSHEDLAATLSGTSGTLQAKVGDVIHLKYEIGMPENVKKYSRFDLKLGCELAKGLSASNYSVKLDSEIMNGSNYTMVKKDGSVSLEIPDTLKIGCTKDSVIELGFDVTVGDEIARGESGNLVTAELEYTADVYDAEFKNVSEPVVLKVVVPEDVVAVGSGSDSETGALTVSSDASVSSGSSSDDGVDTGDSSCLWVWLLILLGVGSALRKLT